MFILFNHVSFLLKRCLQVSQFCSFSNVVRICYCALFNCVMPPYVCAMVQNENKTLLSLSFFNQSIADAIIGLLQYCIDTSIFVNKSSILYHKRYILMISFAVDQIIIIINSSILSCVVFVVQ